MKHFVISFAIFLQLWSCHRTNAPLHSDIITRYYQAFDEGDFAQLKVLIADSMTIAEGDYEVTYSRSSFYEQYKWDSIFQPTYKLVELEESPDAATIATVLCYSQRYEFLKNNPLTCRYKFEFSSDKIARIQVLDCPNTDWATWQAELDSLVSWIRVNHPELDGFNHDLSQEGAMNYLEAIELYKSRE